MEEDTVVDTGHLGPGWEVNKVRGVINLHHYYQSIIRCLMSAVPTSHHHHIYVLSSNSVKSSLTHNVQIVYHKCSWRWQLSCSPAAVVPSCSVLSCSACPVCSCSMSHAHSHCSCTRAREICTDPWRALNFAKLTFDHPCYIVCYSDWGGKKCWIQ